MTPPEKSRMERSMGFFGATGVGVGAIVGSGVLALSGIAFATTGPSAIIAFGLNGILAMLSALRSNLLAASRIALVMAHDRALPRHLSRLSKSRKTPIYATVLSMIMVTAILFMIPDIAKAGAAASLIFLVSFALAHWTAILARIRTGSKRMPFLAPWFPATHIAGAVACIGLTIFQGIQVPFAGLIVTVWLAIGIILYLIFFVQRASIVDVSSAALDPQLQLLRARILGSLQYQGVEQISFLQILPKTTPEKSSLRARELLRLLAEDERINDVRIIVELSDNPVEVISRQAAENDLLILGLQRLGRRRKMIGNTVQQIAGNTSCGLILINRKR